MSKPEKEHSVLVLAIVTQMLFSAFTTFLLPFHSPDRLVLRLQCYQYNTRENVECYPGLYNLQCPITPQLLRAH